MPNKKEMPSTGLLSIDLGAIQYNWLYLQKIICKGNARSSCAAVVKADAYGLGVKPVSLALVAVGCKDFFVATLDEGEELRKVLGVEPRIFVLGGVLHGFNEKEFGERWNDFNLIPVLYSASCIERWIMFCQQRNKTFPCVLKVDTGMHRLGVPAEELDTLFDRILHDKSEPALFAPVLLMSHLACADEPNNLFNQEQLLVFKRSVTTMQNYFPNTALSLSNSSGIFLGEDFHFDLCRPGIALYGGNPTIANKAFTKNPMSQVVKLSLPVMQCRRVQAGESVGYGKTFTAKKETHLATVFGGYADGVLRALSSLGYAWCSGVKVPIVGRVSMDSIVFDITGLDVEPDSIQFFESAQCLDNVASSAQTISYELLTSLGTRYKRQYISGKRNAASFDLSGIAHDK